MNKRIQAVQAGEAENHLLPFFWQHGEDEATLRDYMRAIHESGCGAVCVESRPHPDFCGPTWWRDMDIILDEAKKRNMKVWILDDSHFPTGFCNGALKEADPSLCRQSVACHELHYSGKPRTVRFNLEKLSHPPKVKLDKVARIMTLMQGKQRHYDDDTLLSITAYGPAGEVVPLPLAERWNKPAGDWDVRACLLSRNLGPHRSYMNMMSGPSCHKLIEAVYEPHWEHYKELFGTTIAGFFSDEPELGNGRLYAKHNTLGTEQDLPWSAELAAALEDKFGEGYKNLLPLLWKNDADPLETGNFRVAFMDAVSSLVAKDFSRQVGEWCTAHGVEYIGHIIEDDDTHSCTGSSLGHYFRSLSGQHMAGLDAVTNQIMPQSEEEPSATFLGPRNGGFYHYTLAKLGPSLAYLDPKKQGRTMAEIFGNYGWKFGVSDMKYLADHFLTRGVNYFVPHAFTPKAYPDPDCPPHFYAHGHNPQYRAFGELMRYMNRVAPLITGGKIVAKVAVLYWAESDWAGGAEFMDKTVRLLYDAQIDFAFLPLDSIEKAADYAVLIVTPGVYQDARLKTLPNAVFVDKLPEHWLGAGAALGAKAGTALGAGTAGTTGAAAGTALGAAGADTGKLTVVPKAELVPYLEKLGVRDAVPTPPNPYLHVLHYEVAAAGTTDGAGYTLYLLNNEGKDTWRGTVAFPQSGPCYAYNAWDNRFESVTAETRTRAVGTAGTSDCAADVETIITLTVEPRKPAIIIFDEPPAELAQPLCNDLSAPGTLELTQFTRSTCAALDYPRFAGQKAVRLPDPLQEEQPKFSGYVRYETTFDWPANTRCVVEIPAMSEGIELFVNGKSAGIQIVAPYRFEVTHLLKPAGTNGTGAGKTSVSTNELAVEVATTLEREAIPSNPVRKAMAGKPTGKTGLPCSVFVTPVV